MTAKRKGEKMNIYKKITELLPVIYPVFYTLQDNAQNEYVLLSTATSNMAPILCPITDKTQFEAFENHVHLFDNCRTSDDYNSARAIGTEIAKHLYTELKSHFPNKRFIVYFTLNRKEAILRFHQIWKDEPVYYDETMQYDAEIISFHE